MSTEVLFAPRHVTESKCVQYLVLSGVWSPLATSVVVTFSVHASTSADYLKTSILTEEGLHTLSVT